MDNLEYITDEQLYDGAGRLGIVVKALVHGLPVQLPGEEYQIGMSTNSHIGWIYNGHVVGDLACGVLIFKLGRMSFDEWSKIASYIALNQITRGETW